MDGKSDLCGPACMIDVTGRAITRFDSLHEVAHHCRSRRPRVFVCGKTEATGKYLLGRDGRALRQRGWIDALFFL